MVTPKLEQLLEYLRSELPEVRIRHWGTLEDQAPLLLRFDVPGIGARHVGITRELWDRTAEFAQLREHMERHAWRKAVVSPASEQYLTLGESGWLPPDWKAERVPELPRLSPPAA